MNLGIFGATMMALIVTMMLIHSELSLYKRMKQKNQNLTLKKHLRNNSLTPLALLYFVFLLSSISFWDKFSTTANCIIHIAAIVVFFAIYIYLDFTKTEE
jgi:L-asparagine transporter-like permease